MHGDDDDGEVGVVAEDLVRELESATPLQREVRHQQVGGQTFDGLEPGVEGPGLGAHGEVGLGLEELAEAPAEDRVVVDQDGAVGNEAAHRSSPRAASGASSPLSTSRRVDASVTLSPAFER